MPPFIGLFWWAFLRMHEYYEVVSSRMRGGLLALPVLGSFAKPPGLDNQAGGQAFSPLDWIPSRGEYEKVNHCDTYPLHTPLDLPNGGRYRIFQRRHKPLREQQPTF